MHWIFLQLISHFFWSLVNVGDKYIVNEKIQNPYVYMVLLGLFGLWSIILIPFIEFFIPYHILFLIVIAGAVYFYGGLPYI